ncbi:MAG: hypothetical protein QOD99_2828 [Chthoniobacter sp.]|jgi:hypothetical protein|nr:hypothetical protein [Chthoniobacter sp.]
MNTHSTSEKIAVALLFIAAVAWRLVTGFSGNIGWLPNFAPLAALALCGAIYLPKRVAFILPLAALFVSDLVLNAHYGAPLIGSEMVVRYVALALVGLVGFSLRAKPHFGRVMLGSVAGTVIFYTLTNAASWLGNPAYPQNFAGLTQSLTTGLPGFPPSWMFFRNALCSDLLFSALFAACMAATREREFRIPLSTAATGR